MKQLLVALSAVVFAFASLSALAQTPRADDTPPAFTPGEAQADKAAWDAAKAKWASMTPAEKAAVKKGAQSKKLADLSALEMVGENDMTDLTPEQTAKYKADHAAAKAKLAAMTPDQRAALKKAAQQKRLADLSMMEKLTKGN
jgi:hypothetical protein